jgi:uncharacterized membrane protein YccF (DUF307 family)
VTKQQNGQLTAREIDRPQVNIILRAIYFVLIGWVDERLWMEAAYAVCLTIIGAAWFLDVRPGCRRLFHSNDN